MTVYVAYCRVSTDKQGASGLGLEAQQAAINGFLREGDRLLAPAYVEIESGRKSDRPQLQAAIAQCRKTGATLLIAKLDRLARNLAFIANLIEAGIPFCAADMPFADKTTIQIFAVFAEKEADMISQRTKAALAAAKARGRVLGGHRGVVPSDTDRAKAADAVKAKAAQAAHGIMPLIEELQAMGVTSLNGIAAQLNEWGHRTPRGGDWTATAVKRTLARVAQY